MKRIFRLFTLMTLVSLLACNEAKRGNDSESAYDNDDSKEQADEANDEKFEDNSMENDADFVSNAVSSNYGEIQLAQLASQRSQNAEVKQIANLLITEHTKTLNELKTLAQAKAISIPNEADKKDLDKAERYGKEQSRDFDKKWCKEMIDKHEESINKYEKRMDKTEDAELKAWIGKTIPHLRNHLQKLNACHEKIKDSNS